MGVADKDALNELLVSVRFRSSAHGSVLKKLVGETAWQRIGGPELKEPADDLERADKLKKKWNTALKVNSIKPATSRSFAPIARTKLG